MVLAVACAGFALIVRTVHSPFGQVLKTVKENEPRAVSLGEEVERYKLLAFVLSASLAGWQAPPNGRTGLRDTDRRHYKLGESVGMVTGPILIVCVPLYRRGIVGEMGALLESGMRTVPAEPT